MEYLKLIIIFVVSILAVQSNTLDDSHIYKRQVRNQPTAKQLVCFLHSWNAGRRGVAKFTPLNINPYLCDQIVYAHADLDNEQGIRSENPRIDIDQNGYILFTNLKRHNKNLKTLLGIGGYFSGSARFSSLVTDERRRKAFPKLAIQFLREYNFDGMNLNWQVPSMFEKSRPTDKENYVKWCEELKAEFEQEAVRTGRPRLLLTMSISGNVDYIDRGFDIQKLTPILDWMYLLTYDFHTPYETFVNHHTPLYPYDNYPEYMDSRLTVNYTINYLLRIGADRTKLIMGLPAYGRTFTLFSLDHTDFGSPADGQGEQTEYTLEKGFTAFFEICSSVNRSKGWTVEQPYKNAIGPYAYRGKQWISYDDLDMIKLKTKFALDHDLAGVLFMSMDMDDFRGTCYNKSYPLIEAAKELIKTYEFNANEASQPKNNRNWQSAEVRRRNFMTTPEPPQTPDPDEDLVLKVRREPAIQSKTHQTKNSYPLIGGDVTTLKSTTTETDNTVIRQKVPHDEDKETLPNTLSSTGSVPEYMQILNLDVTADAGQIYTESRKEQNDSSLMKYPLIYILYPFLPYTSVPTAQNFGSQENSGTIAKRVKKITTAEENSKIEILFNKLNDNIKVRINK